MISCRVSSKSGVGDYVEDQKFAVARVQSKFMVGTSGRLKA
jgi:hypothetical protein